MTDQPYVASPINRSLTALTLTDMAAAIKAEHLAVRNAGQSFIEHAINAGQLLIKAKSKFPHGHWLPWLLNNCDIGERTAQNYMRLARNIPRLAPSKSAGLADMTLTKALEELGGDALLVSKKPELIAIPTSEPVQSQQPASIEGKPQFVIKAEATEIDAVDIVTSFNNKAAVPVKASKPSSAAIIAVETRSIENSLRTIALEVPEQDIVEVFEAARRLVDKYEATARKEGASWAKGAKSGEAASQGGRRSASPLSGRPWSFWRQTQCGTAASIAFASSIFSRSST